MTRARTLLIAWCVAAGAAYAQAPEPASDDDQTGEVSLGVGQTDSDTLSSKFEEYRDLPNGLTAPSLRFRGQKDGFRWDFAGRNVQQRDQRYWLTLGKGPVRIEGQYNQIPHRFGNAGHT